MDKQLTSFVFSLEKKGMKVRVQYILHDGDEPLMVVQDLQTALEEGTFVAQARVLREVIAEKDAIKLISRVWVF